MTDSLIIPDGHQSNLPDTQSDNGPDMDLIADLGSVQKLKRRIEGVSKDTKASRARGIDFTRIAKFMHHLAKGETHKTCSEATGCPWPLVHGFIGTVPAIRAIYEVSKELGAVIRQQLREHTADNRAIDGWEEDVWYKGKPVGKIRRFSDRLLETMLTAHDKPKYGKDTKTEVSIGVGISFTSQGVDHSKKAVDVQCSTVDDGESQGDKP